MQLYIAVNGGDVSVRKIVTAVLVTSSIQNRHQRPYCLLMRIVLIDTFKGPAVQAGTGQSV